MPPYLPYNYRKTQTPETTKGYITVTALAFYRSKAGTLLAYFRCQHDGKRQDIPLGNMDKSGKNGISIAQAREKTTQLSEIYRTITTDVKGHLAHLQQQELEKREQQRRTQEESERRALLGNLGRLMSPYSEYLQWQGKASAKQVTRDLNTHLLSYTRTAPKTNALF